MSSKNKKKKSKSPFSQLFEKNAFVLLFSLIIAVVLWCAVSIFQTSEIEKQFNNIKVQLNYEGSLPDNNDLKIFDEQEYYIDVTVKGKSYLLNDSDFPNKIIATVSFASVTSPGTYNLPITVNVEAGDVEVVQYSKPSISLYFDETVEKSFNITDEIIEIEGYSLPEGYLRENPRLSVDSVTVQGPSIEMSRLTSVKAVVELDKELTSTETFTSEIVFVGSGNNSTFNFIKLLNEDPVYVTIPVSVTTDFTPAINFTNVPKDYRETPLSYSVSPNKVKVTVAAGDNELINADEIIIGSIDFSELNNTYNEFHIVPDDTVYSFVDKVEAFKVTVNLSDMNKRWLEVAVSADDIKLPENAELLTKSIQSVQVVGPTDSVMNIDNSEAYVVLSLDDVELKSGINEVPVKILLRTLTDSWVRGTYTVQIKVN
ncbi:MAG: hypothetical protein J1E34_08080 [Oscillospiraceae bacterium]|nr:hypothetical protein [Oscillospiraceae bacterium]